MLWVSVFGCSAFLIVYARVVTKRKGSTFNIYWCWGEGLLSRNIPCIFLFERWRWSKWILDVNELFSSPRWLRVQWRNNHISPHWITFWFFNYKITTLNLEKCQGEFVKCSVSWRNEFLNTSTVQVIPQFAAKTRIFLSLFIIFSRYKKNHSSCCILSFVVPILGALYGQSCFYLTLKSE